MRSLVIETGLLLSLMLCIAATIRTVRIDKSASGITYHANHPLHSWTGINKKVDGVVRYSDSSGRISKVAILAKVADFNSENSNRDSHMIEAAEALKYPNVNFVSSEVIYGEAILVKGNLTFHGITKPIQFNVVELMQDNRKIVTGNFDIGLTDFNIDPPSLMFVKTDNTINISFRIVFPQ